MRNTILKIAGFFVFVLTIMSSCVDDLLYKDGFIGEGESRIVATLEYKPFVEAKLGTRAAGDSYDNIRNMRILVYNEAGDELVKEQTVDMSTAEISGDNVEVPFSLPFGKYQIYSVGNVDNLSTYDYSTVDKLKAIQLIWQMPDKDGNIGRNDQMLGYMMVENESIDEDTPVVTINRREMKLHSCMVRAASKITVAYDASTLKDNISITIKSVSIKDIPRVCFLGDKNTIKAEDDLIANGGTIEYPANIVLTNKEPYYPRKADGSANLDEAHSHTQLNSLFFFENLQGEGMNKAQQKDKDSGELNVFRKDAKPYGTYIEVEAYYISKNPGRPGQGNIKYCFMLGNNITTNYDVTRNHHYKLTLRFNGYADDPDWHIQLEQYLSVPQPAKVNYKGLRFKSNGDGWNQGHDFVQNEIIVNSFQEDITSTSEGKPAEKKPVGIKIEYVDDNGNPIPKPSWVNHTAENVPENGKDIGRTKITFNYESKRVDPFTINSILSTRTVSGTKNLAGTGASDIVNTANCYIVDAKGTYMLPLVYGNAIKNSADNKGAYIDDRVTDQYAKDWLMLKGFENYAGNAISSPYILTDTKVAASQLKAELVWMDEQNLVTGISFVPSAYGNKGGIQFSVNNPREGNAVIAIKQGDVALWSWHIWVTCFDFRDKIGVTDAQYEEVNTLTNHTGEKFRLLPVNLGWCSTNVTTGTSNQVVGADNNIICYPRHECKMRISAVEGEFSEIITIIQEPHIAFPAGNNPYYQWGRKDPFVGNYGSWKGNEKPWYNSAGAVAWPYTIPLLNAQFVEHSDGRVDNSPNDRPTSIENLANMIKYPGRWNNPKRVDWKSSASGEQGTIDDQVYSNLWGSIHDGYPRKTVYDPCPVGYQVAPRLTFTGTTNTGDNTGLDTRSWYNVDNANAMTGYKYNQGLFDFYINKEKLVSMQFPLTGYHDYESNEVYFLNVFFDGDKKYIQSQGYLWTSVNDYWALAEKRKNYQAWFFKYYPWRGVDSPGEVGPLGLFYATDGCPVRACKEK